MTAFLLLAAAAIEVAMPVFDTSLESESARRAALAEFRRAKASRIFVATNAGRLRESIWPGKTEKLREIVRFFETNGLDVTVWIGETVGHGGAVEAEKRDGGLAAELPFTPLTSLDGSTQVYRFCPLDSAFRARVTNYVASVARSGAKTLMLDDDLRLNETLPVAACACDRHLAAVRRLCDEPKLTREELARTAFTGSDNVRRQAFIRANGDSLRLFCRDIRAAVDEVDPSVRVGLASPHSTFGIDGATSAELAAILAGKGNRPLLRLHGAPYWANAGWMLLPSVFELARQFAALTRAESPDAELLTEGDVYPRPRYHTSAASLSLFDAAMRADGTHDVALKYMLDYHASLAYERGYVDRHLHDLPALEAIERWFPDGANEGVRIRISMDRFLKSDFALSPRTTDGPIPFAGFACAFAGVPTVYRGEGAVEAAFGEDVRDVIDGTKPLVVDAVGATILMREGVDCGLAGEGAWTAETVRYLKASNPDELALVDRGVCRLLSAPLKPGAKVILRAEAGETVPLAYVYENAAGRRFLVSLYDGMSITRASGLHRGYLARRALLEGYRFLTGRNPSVVGPAHPDLYLATARGVDGSLSILIANCSADALLEPVFELDRVYACVACPTADRIRLDGTRLVFADPIPAFEFRVVHLSAEDVVDFADPMVGTAGTGHCSPAAAFPFGMVQPGADTGRAGWNYCAGYYYPDTTLVGFSQTHLNGTGSTDLGDLSIFPFTGERPAKFESRFSHERETASPGYYAVTLDDFGVRAEATCSKRVAYYRFTSDKSLRLFVDPTSVMNGGENDPQTRVVRCELKAEGDRCLAGSVAKKGWIARKLWFVIEADRPLAFKDGVWSGTDKELKVRIAVSASSLEGAKRNLASDRCTWDFDRIRGEARSAWRSCLERVPVPKGTSETVKRNLATALYRLCLQPNLLSDEGEKTFYTTFSLWDTYRAAHPLYCELFPEMVPDFVNSLLEQGRRTGYLPVWALWGRETDWMIGTHSIPVIADAFLRGIPDVDWVAAYAQVRDTLMNRHGRAKVDWGLLDRYGYYPCDIVKGEGVSRLLEDTFDCWCAGKMAEKLGRTDDAALFFRRANAWTNVYDRSIGFMRGRRTDGGWRTPFDPREVGHNVDTDNDFTEGNAFPWTWHVLQDPRRLIDAMGGAAAAEKRLDELFASDSKLTGDACKDDVTGMIGQYVHGNEPSHHIPWLYALCGRPDKTKAIVGEIMEKFYRPSPDGLCGNDDCGQMSAWYVWAFLGRYPVTPCGRK